MEAFEIGQIPDQAFRDWTFADAFGWTPDDCDKVGAARLDWIMAVHNLVKKVNGGSSNRVQRSDPGNP